MKVQHKVLEVITRYKNRFPQEAKSVEAFENFVAGTNNDALYSRKNFTGHITASGAILNREGSKILLLKHKFLGIWLLPGGHVDPEDASIIDAAYREIKEETGIHKDDLIPLSFTVSPEPIELDSHPIPERPEKQELKHYHHDFRYAFMYKGEEKDIEIDPDESDAIQWVELEKLEDNERFAKMLPKLKVLKSMM